MYRWGTMGGLRGEGEGRHREDLALLSAAERLGVDRATVWCWCREGRIPCLKIGRLWRVRRAELGDFAGEVEDLQKGSPPR